MFIVTIAYVSWQKSKTLIFLKVFLSVRTAEENWFDSSKSVYLPFPNNCTWLWVVTGSSELSCESCCRVGLRHRVSCISSVTNEMRLCFTVTRLVWFSNRHYWELNRLGRLTCCTSAHFTWRVHFRKQLTSVFNFTKSYFYPALQVISIKLHVTVF